MEPSTLIPITWSRYRLRENPRLGIIAIAITVLVALTVFYTLGPSAISTTLVVVFIFSLRSILFPHSVLIDPFGWHKSTALTGATSIPWERIKKIDRSGGIITLHLARKHEVFLKPLDSTLASEVDQIIDAWQEGWHPESAHV
jgi:hypothetical protein